MGNFRPRVKGKGKRWRKGHSSSSNPETKKYRDVAKCSFFQENPGEGNLTSDALKKHNAILGSKHEFSDDEDGEKTFDGTLKSFKTFASNWTECSNVSFNRLLNGFRSDSAIHKEMLALLAAVTEVIKSNGGKETSVEYLGALMTVLEGCESEESLSAALQLLGMVIKNVPVSVLRLKYAEMSKNFIEFLGKFSESDNTSILRSLIGCLSVLLRAQEAVLWSSSSTLQAFDSILAYTVHTKPKVRKAAQHAVCAILKGSNFMLGDDVLEYHPGAVHVAKYLIQQIESSKSLGGSTTTLHILSLLKEILGTFPKPQLKSACESILKIMTLGNLLVTSCGMQALYGLFVSRPPASRLSPQLNAQLISALYDYQPSPSDTQPTIAWLTVMQDAYINLGKSDLGLCVANLMKLFSTVMQLLLSDKSEVMNTATLTLQAVTEDCIALACSPMVYNSYRVTLAKIFGVVEAGLTYQYHSSWHNVLHIIATWYRIGGDTCKDFMSTSLKNLGELRDSYKFSNVNEVEFAVGQAIRSMGPETVLSAIPLEITGEEINYEFKRSWLLPILKQNISSDKLEFFIKYFLPIATICRKKIAILSSKNDGIGSHSYDLLQSQIWSLLPCFCNNPQDLKSSFKLIAKILGTALGEYKELRLDTLSALRRLITSSLDAKNEENINEISRFAKNYLPILFNLYTTKAKGTDEEGQRLAAYETIKVYLKVTDAGHCHDLFDRAVQKLDEENIDAHTKESIFDLLRALLPYEDTSRIGQLFSCCETRLSNTKNHHEQKKAYRILEELCANDSEECKKFVNENLMNLEKLLIDSLSTSAAPCKGPRLRCLIHLIKKLDNTNMDILKQIIPEAILCCKDINERCRTAAFNLLVEIGKLMLADSDKSQEDIIREYLRLLMAGLAGSPTLITATILALARAVHEYKDIMPFDLVQLVLENVCLLMTTSTREIVSSSLSFVKMFLTTFSYDEVVQEISTIVKSLTGMTEDCKRHFRVPTRNLLDRLVRKFGYDVISSMVPKSDESTQKRLNNLRKIQARKNKLRSREEKDESDEDMFKIQSHPKSIEEVLAESEESDVEDEEIKSKKIKKKSKTWIEENVDDIIDFTDTTVVKKITATNPGIQNNPIMEKKKKSSEFKIAADGRLIITENSDDESTGKRKRDVDSDSEDEKPRNIPLARKRKLSISTDASETASKYRAGGVGIHRPTKMAKRSVSTGVEYRAKKAKGDVKKKGKPDPYAYVPLSRKMLNKRKQKKQAGQFAGFCRAAHKGAKKGAVFRKKNVSKRN
ncbi:hypothetical protein L9F63_017728 [Diploptera punctata]|uniref:RRP12-like protein n=1 Tax=Diploptera punctata TaxID=6984 RepID=A0AAD8A041_DIPPU|nr:hypothetical protein L9F63_017728 [Diploptera punctata]